MIKIKKKLGGRDVVMNKIYDTRTEQALDSEYIFINRVEYDRMNGFLIVEFCLGAVNSGGEFKIDSDYKPITYRFSRETTRKLWEDNKLDESMPTLEIIENMLLAEKPIFHIVATRYWGKGGLLLVEQSQG